jgi:diguanylate cyclase (GGDEF)-like protein
VRPDDLVARIGGDEFAVILPDAGLEHAEQVAERIREAAAAIELEGFGALSACTGAATGPNDGVARTLAHADEELYQAKRARPGRPTVDDRLRYVIDRHRLARGRS